MKSSVVSLAVFFSTLDLSFSLRCYKCSGGSYCKNPTENAPTCEATSRCFNAVNMDASSKLVFGCDSDDTVDCTDRYLCDYCQDKDLCNKPMTSGGSQNDNSGKCYNCMDGKGFHEALSMVSSMIPSCSSPQIISCNAPGKCMSATGKDGKGRFYACDGGEFYCKQLNLENCKTCTGHLCNKVKGKGSAAALKINTILLLSLFLISIYVSSMCTKL